MRAHTRSVTIAALPRHVFAYVARPENLPTWAFDFAESIRSEDDYWIATTQAGETRFALRAEEAYGVIDFLGLITADSYVLRAPTRVVPNGANHSEYLFTLFQAPRETDEAFTGRLAILCQELALLRQILESDPAHANKPRALRGLPAQQ